MTTAPPTPEMRLIVASVQEYDATNLLTELASHGWRATEIASTGHLLRPGSSTLLIGVPASEVRRVLRLVREHCQVDTAAAAAPMPEDSEAWYPATEVALLGGAAFSVLKVVRFTQL